MTDKIKALRLKEPFGLDNIQVTEMDDPGQPGPGEIRVKIKASSLNFHDYGVAAGFILTEDGRIPMSDGAGVVEAVGDGVEEFKVGDNVVSTFFPYRQSGPAPVGDFRNTPGDHQKDFVRALEANGVKPVIDKTFALEELADAFRYEESGKHFGKICVEF
jgi:NADPH:quinone reductase-like Zn-dependent oxidoreductase